jgi:hypothetical protein
MYPAYKGQVLYVWGQIKYRDVTGEETTPVKFCRYVSGKAVLEAPIAIGYGGGPYTDCQ